MSVRVLARSLLWDRPEQVCLVLMVSGTGHAFGNTFRILGCFNPLFRALEPLVLRAGRWYGTERRRRADPVLDSMSDDLLSLRASPLRNLVYRRVLRRILAV